MAVFADSQGIVTGKFTIPTGIPAGNKTVLFSGSGGSLGSAIFSGQGTLERRTNQNQTTITETRWWSPPPPPPVVVWPIDPLAQTFSIDQAAQISGVDLWFTAKGTSSVIVQIRETTVGFPNRSVLTSKRLTPAQITVGGGHTRVTFDTPITLFGNTEYAIVVLSDDAVTALAVAELGKWEPNLGQWVTAQPYQVGVLLSSSNASTWTPHQDRDMAFRLLRATFTQTTRTIDLGAHPVVGATDLMVMAYAELPSSSVNVEYRLELPGGDIVTVSDGQPVQLATPVTGDVAVSAVLTGDANWFPVLYPDIQLVAGAIETTSDYVSRAIEGGSSVRVKAVFDANIPSGASVAVKYKGGDIGDTWTELPYVSATPGDNGFFEITHEASGVNEQLVQIKLELTGTSAARPRVRNLRFMTI